MGFFDAAWMRHFDVHSTWIRKSDGQAFALDHVVTYDPPTIAMRPWSAREYTVIEVSGDELLDSWSMVETMGQAVARRRRERDLDCERGRHEDPDNSGLCIHCSAILDGDEDGEDE